MKCARTFRVALVGELRRMLRSPGLWVALLVPLALSVALLWYAEDAPRFDRRQLLPHLDVDERVAR